MKEYTMFSFEFLFNDHFAQVSDQAKMLYIKMNFYATNGFVANPYAILDSLGYDKSVLQELIINEDILSLPDRCEVFITAYFVHNKGLNKKTWWNSPFAVYWKGKLQLKENGIATFKQQEAAKTPLSSLNLPLPPGVTEVDLLNKALDLLRQEKEQDQ